MSHTPRFFGGLVAEAFAGKVEDSGQKMTWRLSGSGELRAFWQVLPQQAFGVLVAIAFPSMVRGRRRERCQTSERGQAVRESWRIPVPIRLPYIFTSSRCRASNDPDQATVSGQR